MSDTKRSSEYQTEDKDTIFIPDSQKAPSLPDFAMFDKVINLKIRRGYPKGKDETKNSFVIRSDYEVVWNESRTKYQIQRCSIKPQIRVSFRMVTGSLGIETDIYITNFHIFNEEGMNSLDDWSYGTNPITEVELVMGYAPMFNKPANLKEFFGVKEDGSMSLPKPNGAAKLVLNTCEFVTTDNPPPDSVFHIHGYVNSIDSGFRSKVENESVTSMLSNEDFTFNNAKKGGKTFVERLFYYLIQRRFLGKAVSNELLESEKAIDTKTGYLTKEGAEKYGCKVIIPEGSRVNSYRVSTFRNEKGELIEGGSNVVIWLNSGNSVAGTLLMIQNKFFQGLRFAPTLDGNWVVWDEADYPSMSDGGSTREKKEKIIKFLDSCSYKVSGSSGGIVIPAVNSISVSAGTCTIVCPFFSFLNPFQKLLFNSRYVYSDMTNYFARTSIKVSQFFAISSQVEFSTTGAENKQTITAIGLDKYN